MFSVTTRVSERAPTRPRERGPRAERIMIAQVDGGTAKLGGHALYDVALNLVFLGLQYVSPGKSHALEEERRSKLPFST